jgi:hypothetical protein
VIRHQILFKAAGVPWGRSKWRSLSTICHGRTVYLAVPYDFAVHYEGNECSCYRSPEIRPAGKIQTALHFRIIGMGGSCQFSCPAWGLRSLKSFIITEWKLNCLFSACKVQFPATLPCCMSLHFSLNRSSHLVRGTVPSTTMPALDSHSPHHRVVRTGSVWSKATDAWVWHCTVISFSLKAGSTTKVY